MEKCIKIHYVTGFGRKGFLQTYTYQNFDPEKISGQPDKLGIRLQIDWAMVSKKVSVDCLTINNNLGQSNF